MQIVPKSIRSQHNCFLARLGISELVVAPVKHIRNWLLLVRIRIILYQVILPSKHLQRNVKLSLLLLCYKVLASSAKYSKN